MNLEDLNAHYRIVNINYEVDGLRFDAAIDCDWQMHAYDLGLWGIDNKSREEQTPVELYCFDHTDWDIRMVYIEARNDQQDGTTSRLLYKSVVDWKQIIEATKEWIAEMTKHDAQAELEL